MADTSTDHIVVACNCGAKLKVPAAAAGRKAKCRKCGEVFTIPQADAPEPPPAAANSEDDSLLDELAALSKSAPATSAGAPDLSAAPCSNCGMAMPAGANACPICGHSAKPATPTPKAQSTSPSKVAAIAGLAGTFALGCGLSTTGALIGAAVWTGVAIITGYEIVWIAWGVGLLAGGGMALGYRNQSQFAGIVASGIALFGIVVAKILVFSFVIYAMVTGDTDNVSLQREILISYEASEILINQDKDPENVSDAEWSAAERKARGQIDRLSDAEVRARWDEYRQELEEWDEIDSDARAESAPAADGRPAEAPGSNLDDTLLEEEDASLGELLTFFFAASFGLFDILFVGLAVVSAFKIASGMTGD